PDHLSHRGGAQTPGRGKRGNHLRPPLPGKTRHRRGSHRDDRKARPQMSDLSGSGGVPSPITPQTVVIEGVSNREFLERYAKAGCVGLSRGPTLADKVIVRAERHVAEDGRPGDWSHAFLFEGVRADGHHWVIESDLHVARKHIRLGVQENRLTKYFDEK